MRCGSSRLNWFGRWLCSRFAQLCQMLFDLFVTPLGLRHQENAAEGGDGARTSCAAPRARSDGFDELIAEVALGLHVGGEMTRVVEASDKVRLGVFEGGDLEDFVTEDVGDAQGLEERRESDARRSF